MKKLIKILTLICALMLLSACGNTGSETDSPEESSLKAESKNSMSAVVVRVYEVTDEGSGLICVVPTEIIKSGEDVNETQYFYDVNYELKASDYTESQTPKPKDEVIIYYDEVMETAPMQINVNYLELVSTDNDYDISAWENVQIESIE